MDSIRKTFDSYRWFGNLLIFGLPWTILVVLFDTYNIYYNMEGQKWWAYGNVFLIANTAVQLVQGLGSSLLVAEIPAYLVRLKLFRALSLMGAIAYVVFYVWCLLEWFWGIYFAEPKDEDFVELLLELVLSWHIVFHFPVMLTSLVIILKELMIEKDMVYRKIRGIKTGTNIGLGLSEAGKALGKAWDMLNPLNWWGNLQAQVKKDKERKR